MFQGSLVALVTPMQPTGEVDYSAIEDLIDWHIKEGTDGIVVLGTTGESPVISEDERNRIITTAVRRVKSRIPLLAGTGSNSTAKAIRLTQHAMELGVDACLLVTPYYNKPTQEGLYQHFKAVAQAVSIPQVLYNVPGRTGCDLQPDTVIRLAGVPNIVGVKEATGDVARVPYLLAACGSRLDLLSGDDITCADFMLQGGKGVISVTANVAPRAMHDLSQAALAKDVEKVKALNAPLLALHHKLFIESNPIPVKWALAQMGKIDEKIRLPLTTLSAQHQPHLRAVLQEAGVL